MKIFCLKANLFNPKCWAIMIASHSSIVHTGMIFDHLTEKPEGFLKVKKFDPRYATFDASESRGDVSWSKDIRDYGGRKVWVYSIPDEHLKGYNYAMSRLDNKYDYGGIGGYLLHLDDDNRDFCSELTINAMIEIFKKEDYKKSEVEFILGQRKKDPNTQKYILDELSKNKLYGIRKVYEGAAKDYV